MRKMLDRLMVVVMLMFVALGSWALSPWTSQPQISAPLQSTTISCTHVAVSSITAGSIVAANSTREALYVINKSSVNTAGKAVPAEVILSTWAITNATAFGSIPGIVLSPHNWSSSTKTDANTTFLMNGGAVYQGTLYAIAEGTGAVVNVCEFNP